MLNPVVVTLTIQDSSHRFVHEEQKCDDHGNVVMPRNLNGYHDYCRYIRQNTHALFGSPNLPPQFRVASSFCLDVLQEIINNNEDPAEDSRCFDDLEHLYQITNILKNPYSPLFPQEMIERAKALKVNDRGKSSNRNHLANALLAAAGAVLVVAGTMALCSGVGVFAGTFVAAAGAWLLGLAGLTAGTAAAVGVSAGVVIGGSAMSLYGADRFFAPQTTPREHLYTSLLEMRRP